VIGTAAGLAIATPAFAAQARRKAAHRARAAYQGPHVFMNYDQIELDAAYDRALTRARRTDPGARTTNTRRPPAAGRAKARILWAERVENSTSSAPIGRTRRVHFRPWRAWLGGEAKEYHFAAENIITAGAHYVTLDFIAVGAANGDIRVMADQVKRGIAWSTRTHEFRRRSEPDLSLRPIVRRASVGCRHGDRLAEGFRFARRYHQGRRALERMYEMNRAASARAKYVKFDDAMEESMSTIRHIERLRAPVA